MDENMKELCKEHKVRFWDLHLKMLQNTQAGDPRPVMLSPAECEVLKAALEIAGGL